MPRPQKDSLMTAPRWVIFDAVGTLIYPEPSVATAYCDIGRRFGSQVEHDDARRRFQRAYRASEGWDADHPLHIPPQDAGLPVGEQVERARWRWIVREVLGDFENSESCFNELFDHFARPDAWRCFSDVEPALDRLSHAGFRLGVASNFDHRLNAVCDGIEELRRLERRVISSEVGHRKPSADFYRALINACAVPPGQIAMVGDDFVNDVEAARASGLQAWHVRRAPALAASPLLEAAEEICAQLPP